MIVFDLDGTLADCEHRRHFVQKGKKTDWDAFHEACDKDKPIWPTIEVFRTLFWDQCDKIYIWSGRSESVRKKTMKWLDDYLKIFEHPQYDKCEEDGFSVYDLILKMRPIGDYTPDEILKEKWLDERLSKGIKIDFVFDDRPKVVQMWRRRGIHVFDCNQSSKDF